MVHLYCASCIAFTISDDSNKAMVKALDFHTWPQDALHCAAQQWSAQCARASSQKNWLTMPQVMVVMKPIPESWVLEQQCDELAAKAEEYCDFLIARPIAYGSLLLGGDCQVPGMRS